MGQNESRALKGTPFDEARRAAHSVLADENLGQASPARVHQLEKTIAQFEARFGLSSDDVHDAIENKTLVETEEVCDWIMAYELLRRIQGR